MTLEDIKIEYKIVADNLWQTQGFLTYMLKDLRTYFKNYCDALHCDKKFAIILEENLIFMEIIYSELDNLLEYLKSINLLELNEPTIDNAINLSDFKVNEDIYVDLKYPLSLPWNKFEKPKRTFDD